MDKIAAQVRSAEVRGAMAAFIDAGVVKVASAEAFEELCSVVADKLGDDYDLQKVAAVTEAVLSGGEQQEKVAAEKHDRAIKAALGDLLLQKTAGQIDEETFAAQADELMKMAGIPMSVLRGIVKAKQVAGNVVNAGKDAIGKAVVKGKDLAETAALKGMYAADDAAAMAGKAKDAFNGLSNPAKAALVAGAAAVPAVGLGAKALYDKYAE